MMIYLLRLTIYEDITAVKANGKVIDLVFPVIVLIISCIIGMIYTGGFFQGESFINAFANCVAPVGLLLGSVAALIITFVFYMIRRVLTFQEFMSCLPEGFKAMVPAILILTFAWTLSGITGLLGADVFVADFLKTVRVRFKYFFLLLFFVLRFSLPLLRKLLGNIWHTFTYSCAYT